MALLIDRKLLDHNSKLFERQKFKNDMLRTIEASQQNKAFGYKGILEAPENAVERVMDFLADLPGGEILTMKGVPWP